MKKHIFSSLAILLLLLGCTFTACTKNEISAPPTIKIMVNGDDVTAAPSIVVNANERVEYVFEVTAFSVIDNLKTVFYDATVPTKKVSKEVIVAGQLNSTNETVKGVLFVTTNTEIVLVVKDIDGNEVSKTITVTIQ
jgi:hypothetical protein